MNKILVAIDGKRGAWTALSRACSLAKRIDVDLNVLLVASPTKDKLSQGELDIRKELRKKLELLIETAKAEGIRIHYFTTEGNYEDEVINFANNHRIALLVLETADNDARSAARENASLRTLRHRLNCTMELVALMKHISEQFERIT